MILTITKSEPHKLSVVDRREITSSAITKEVTETFNFGGIACRMTIDVTNTGDDDAVLGIPCHRRGYTAQIYDWRLLARGTGAVGLEECAGVRGGKLS
jgi:hypothetical protein